MQLRFFPAPLPHAKTDAFPKDAFSCAVSYQILYRPCEKWSSSIKPRCSPGNLSQEIVQSSKQPSFKQDGPVCGFFFERLLKQSRSYHEDYSSSPNLIFESTKIYCNKELVHTC
ncbi:hypothetical protein O181_052057 [Austropuccinia psidii MF-1]|uniref:Uncharacterized protein n=1 Tax=Austropuccinia psidii MF-1 TaxID=1389203 RepID=A0A9Q3E6V9_9BASI|nr:hypothetical protein [Austropuccinia psidii MF-1]